MFQNRYYSLPFTKIFALVCTFCRTQYISTSSGTRKNGSYSQLIFSCTFIVFVRFLCAFHFQCQVLLSFLFFINPGTSVCVMFPCLEYRTKLTHFYYRNPMVSLPGKSVGVCMCVATSQDSKTGIVEMRYMKKKKKLLFWTSRTFPVDERNDVCTSVIETITRNYLLLLHLLIGVLLFLFFFS